MLMWFHPFALQVRHDPWAPTRLLASPLKNRYTNQDVKQQCRLVFSVSWNTEGVKQKLSLWADGRKIESYSTEEQECFILTILSL